jgi:hypothetical protein
MLIINGINIVELFIDSLVCLSISFNTLSAHSHHLSNSKKKIGRAGKIGKKKYTLLLAFFPQGFWRR